MNENVKNLVEAAGFVFWRDEPWGPGKDTIDWSADYTEEIQTYTELLVKKCISLCESLESTQGTASGAALAIKQYFLNENK